MIFSNGRPLFLSWELLFILIIWTNETGYLDSPYFGQGSLVTLHKEWSGTLPGVFLYYPSRRQSPVPLRVFLDFVKKWRKRPMSRQGGLQLACYVR